MNDHTPKAVRNLTHVTWHEKDKYF